MARTERVWHPDFLAYMDFIINHPNYAGLRIDKKNDGSYSWIATAKSEIGQQRIEWCKRKAVQLGFPIQPGVYADVMLAIHPTKRKVCQTCGRLMSLYYLYPNANFLKSLNKRYETSYTEIDEIGDVWEDLLRRGFTQKNIAAFLIEKGALENVTINSTKQEIIDALEYACRKGGKACLGPGAMSNFPDRFDGFHTYNRCCRSRQDKGRSKENLKSYTKDRRAYEYWSDGNIHAANEFMGSKFFKGISADHIGPISLGFIHDSRYLQPMTSSDNSAKRDRLQVIDIEKILETEERTKIYPMSWYSRIIWEHIKANYRRCPEKVPGLYRDALKQNMANFMYILYTILQSSSENGEAFLTHAFLEPNYDYFNYSYEFNEYGEIISKQPRHVTERSRYEMDRYQRIAIEAVRDYNDKDNRHFAPDLTELEEEKLKQICLRVRAGTWCIDCRERVVDLVEAIERRIVKSL